MRTIITDNIQDLIGIGYEYLTDKNGEIIALFIDGNMSVSNTIDINVNEPTKSVA